ncbi:MAG TPA: hypothetical protein DEG71_09875 [Clostridiales bacterium]|nr:hypothetical protein [Clostridiales bacterium]
MKNQLHTFTDPQTNLFHKETSLTTSNEFLFLKMLHGMTNLPIDTIMHDYKQYTTMPHGHVISIDTIPKKDRNKVKHIITKNIPFMLKQIYTLQQLNIYYSDCLQWLYYQGKLYLIDFDVASYGVDYQDTNYSLLFNFLTAFDIDCSLISDSIRYLDLFRTGIEFCHTEEEQITYNRLNDPSMVKNYIYYSTNKRHIQINTKNIHIYSDNGNMVITDIILNPEITKEWELVRVV